MNRLARSAYAAFAVLCSSAVAFAASAQPYPAKPVRLVVPYPPGGGTDILARQLAQKLSDQWGQQVLVENKPGANGMIGSEQVARAAPDGYTLAVVVATHVINPSVYQKIPYDAIRDFTPVTLFATSPFVLVVHPNLGAKSVSEVIALAKAKPGQLTFGSSEYSSRLAGELFRTLGNLNVVHVPYKGGAPMMTDLLGGHLSFGFTSILTALSHVKAGKLVVLGNGATKRSALLPDVPTMVEAGLGGYEANAWYGIFGPAKVPREIVTRIHEGITRAAATPDLREKIQSQGGEPVVNTPEAFAEFTQRELAKWAKVVKDAGIQPE